MSVWRFLALLCVAIFASEVAIMQLLDYWPVEHGVAESIVDGAILTMVLFPILYFFVVRNAREVQARLEAQVGERTSRLVEANRAIEHSLAQLEQRRTALALLGETSNLLQTCQGIDEAMVVAEAQLFRLLPDLSGALFLMNPSRNRLQKVAGWGQSVATVVCHGPDECWALRRGRPHLTGAKNDGLACYSLRSIERSWHLCLPLIAEGETLGTLTLAAPSPPHATAVDLVTVDADRMDLYVAVAETLSLAVANLRLRETLRYQALRDPLTGLFNRRYLPEALDHELQRAATRAQPLSIIMFDIDHFKHFNDAYGHAAGDTVLAQLGMLLREWARGGDIVVRYGGEEFTIVLPDTSAELALARAESLRQAVVGLTVEHRGQRLAQVTISAGIASSPMHGSDSDMLIQLADQSLYVSKGAGRNRVTLAPVPPSATAEKRLAG